MLVLQAKEEHKAEQTPRTTQIKAESNYIEDKQNQTGLAEKALINKYTLLLEAYLINKNKMRASLGISDMRRRHI